MKKDFNICMFTKGRSVWRIFDKRFSNCRTGRGATKVTPLRERL